MTDAGLAKCRVLSRRDFLAASGLTGVGAALALAGCGSGGESASAAKATAAPASASAGPNLGKLTYAFSWLNDVTQAGPYIADTSGYYTKAGFSAVKFISGGPSAVPAITQLISKTAIIGVSDSASTASAIVGGAKLKVIGAMYQRSPVCIVSLATKPLMDPASLRGKTIGVADADRPTLLAFLTVNKMTASDLKLVPFQYDPAPLIDGQMDGFVGYTTQDPISLDEAGHASTVLEFGSFGFDSVTQLYVATTSAVATSRDVLKGALTADIRGWRDNIADPAKGAHLAVEKYGKSLGYSYTNQLAADKAGLVLMKTPDTVKNGLLTVTPTLVDSTVKALALSGVSITADKLFDLSLVDEIYQEDPSLKTLT